MKYLQIHLSLRAFPMSVVVFTSCLCSVCQNLWYVWDELPTTTEVLFPCCHQRGLLLVTGLSIKRKPCRLGCRSCFQEIKFWNAAENHWSGVGTQAVHFLLCPAGGVWCTGTCSWWCFGKVPGWEDLLLKHQQVPSLGALLGCPSACMAAAWGSSIPWSHLRERTGGIGCVVVFATTTF